MSLNIEIDGITFNAGASGSAYTINNLFTNMVISFGAGITNNSGIVQTIHNENFLEFDFGASAGTTAASQVLINNATSFAVVTFLDATLGSATIDNSGSNADPTQSSAVLFLGSSTADTGIILNSGDNTNTIFSGAATAGSATITNSGAGSFTIFRNDTLGGTAVIENTGPGSYIRFREDSNAESATLTNSLSGTVIEFKDASSAGISTIENKFDTQTVFSNDSTAGGATITNSGAGSSTVFFDASKGGPNSFIENVGTGSFINFNDDTDAEGATLTNTGDDTLIEFFNNATAGSAILNNDNSTASINFLDSATAGGSTINNNGTGPSPALSSLVGFFGTSKAGTATINNKAENVQTLFSDNSSAEMADIHNDGKGSATVFVADATAAGSTIDNGGDNSFTTFSNASKGGDSKISNTGKSSEIDFFDSTTAENATLNNDNATASINFFDSATAGGSTINNNGTGGSPATSSLVSFFNTSKAGTATINNKVENVQTLFSDSSSAMGATINNSGKGSSTVFVVDATAASSTIANSGESSFTTFSNASKAGNSKISNTGMGSEIDFFDKTTAENATLTNTHATSLINFFDSATAGASTINNNGSGATPATSSLVVFNNTSTAASATIHNNGGNVQVLFSDTSTAATANIDNAGPGSSTLFFVNATAGNSTISNTGSDSTTDFQGASTAANSTLNNVNGTASINFFDTATAGSATINNNGSAAPTGSIVAFFGTTTAGTATLTNAGDNSQTRFGSSSTAANSTVINQGAGSGTIFFNNASGGSVRLINANATSFIDISGLATSGTTAGSIEGNGSLRLGSKSLTVGSLNLSTTFSGDIKDGGNGGGTGGALVKVGSGALTLTGANTFSGGTTLQAGGIIVGSSQALGDGNFNLNSGTLSATGATRDINVRGNYTQVGGTVQFRIGGASAGQYDRLSIDGKATLAGTMSVKTVNGFNPQADNRFFVVTAAGGVTGQFATFDDHLSTGALKFGVTYDANNVILEILQSAFLPFARTPNQIAVAAALDRVVAAPKALDLIAFLDTLPARAIPGALDLIAPEELGAMFEITRSAAKTQAFTIQHRLDEIHATTDELPPVLSKEGKTSKDVVEPARRFGVFANGHGEFVSVGSTSNARGYDFDSGGFTLGLDYRFSNHFAAGLLFNYTRADAELTGKGSIESDAIRGGVYASVFGGGAYLNAYIGGAYNEYDTRRSGLLGTARGSTDGSEFTTFVSAGYDAHAGHLTFGPIASYHYTSLDVDSFRERGSLAPLRVALKDAASSRTNLGARASYDWHVGGMVLVPEIRATWQHEFGDVEQTADSRFLFGGPTFTVNSARVGRDSLVLSSGFSLQITPDLAAYAYYDGEIGRSNYDSHNIVGGIRASF